MSEINDFDFYIGGEKIEGVKGFDYSTKYNDVSVQKDIIYIVLKDRISEEHYKYISNNIGLEFEYYYRDNEECMFRNKVLKFGIDIPDDKLELNKKYTIFFDISKCVIVDHY